MTTSARSEFRGAGRGCGVVPIYCCFLAFCLGTACKKDAPSADKQARSERGLRKGPQKGSQQGQPGADGSRIEAGRQVVTWLAAGDYGKVSRGFDKAMRRAFPDDAALAKWWKGVVRQTGKLIKQFGARPGNKGRYQRVIVTCVFAIAPFDGTVAVFIDYVNPWRPVHIVLNGLSRQIL